jgi:hypothetical protein
MQTLFTRVNGHTVTVTDSAIGGGWEAVIDSHIPPMQRDFDLRSVYSSDSASVILSAAMWDIAMRGILEGED